MKIVLINFVTIMQVGLLALKCMMDACLNSMANAKLRMGFGMACIGYEACWNWLRVNVIMELIMDLETMA